MKAHMCSIFNSFFDSKKSIFPFNVRRFSNDNTSTISTFQLLPFWELEVSNSIEKALNISSFVQKTRYSVKHSIRSYPNSNIPTLQTPSGVDVLTINKKKNKCVQSIKGSRLSLAKKAGDVRVGVYVQKGLNTQQRGLSFWDLYFSYTQYCNCITTYLSNCLLS